MQGDSINCIADAQAVSNRFLLLLTKPDFCRMEDPISLEALRQEIEYLRTKMLEIRQPGISVDLERMDVIKNYLVASSTTRFGEDLIGHIESSSCAVSAGVHRDAQKHVPSPISKEGQVGLTASPPGNEAVQRDDTSNVPTFGSFNEWLSAFAPETADPEEDELLSAFRNRQRSDPVNDRIPTTVTIDAIEVASPAEMIPSSNTLSLVSQHLPMRDDLPDGKIHLIFINLKKFGCDQTFTEDIITSPDILVYKLIHELHQKGMSKL